MMAAGDACAMCGERTTELTGGLCDRCNFVLDADLDAGGICVICKRLVDFLEPEGACCPCTLAQQEAHDERMARRPW